MLWFRQVRLRTAPSVLFCMLMGSEIWGHLRRRGLHGQADIVRLYRGCTG